MAKTYSHDLKVGDRLDKLSDSAMKATDEGFYGTASVKELVGWKISKVFRETKDVAEDKIYGGFCYMIATKDDQMIMAFRGSFGEQLTSIFDGKGDWFNNFASYPFGTDPGGAWAELAAEAPLHVNSQIKNLYITGHSRAGMLAQRATVRIVELGKEKLLTRLTYFNGLGIVLDRGEVQNVLDAIKDSFTKPPYLGEPDEPLFVNEKNIDMVKKLFTIGEKIVSIHVVGDKDKEHPFPYTDVVGILGIHVGGRYIIQLSDVALINNEKAINAYHSMSNFTVHIYRGYIKEYDHVQNI